MLQSAQKAVVARAVRQCYAALGVRSPVAAMHPRQVQAAVWHMMRHVWSLLHSDDTYSCMQGQAAPARPGQPSACIDRS